MAVEVPMPRLSDTMEEGTVARWVKREGDHVVAGDVIAEIDTDKATMELTAYEDGVLLKILVGEGESADLGTPIALIGAEGEAVPETAARGNGAVHLMGLLSDAGVHSHQRHLFALLKAAKDAGAKKIIVFNQLHKPDGMNFFAASDHFISSMGVDVFDEMG